MKLFKLLRSENPAPMGSDLPLDTAREIQAPSAWQQNRFQVFQMFRLMQQASGFVRKSQSLIKLATDEVLGRADTLKNTISLAEQKFEHSRENLQHTRSLINADLEQINKSVNVALKDVSTVVSGQIEKASEVLETIESISKELKIIVVNVSLEANRLGAQGESIKAIAQKVGDLAQHALLSAQKTQSELDLAILRSKLAEFEQGIEGLTAKAKEAVSGSMDKLENSFFPIAQTIQQIKDDQQNIFEVKKIDALVDRSVDRLALIEDISERMAGSVRGDSSQDAKQFVQKAEHILLSEVEQVQGDALDSIRQRGVLRVAIEPSFVGLSFRTSGSGLQGLDVDYAQAFARWLGVKVEFVEGPWDQCPEFLTVPSAKGAVCADLMWSALIPDPAYTTLSFSNPYCRFEFVLARRNGDHSIRSLSDLEGKVLGCINDPAVFSLLESEGLRWSDNRSKPGGKVNLAKLQKYTDQSLIHDCLVKGQVDGFLVDLPIYYWAASDAASPWRGKVEIIDTKVGPTSYEYAVGINKGKNSLSLLESINRFLEEFASSNEKKQIDQKWLGR